MIRTAIATACIAAAALTLAACSSGETKTRPIPHVANTGDAPLDQALDASLARDNIEMARLTGYHRVPCATAADASHPACRENEKAGDAVEVLPKLGCDSPGFVRPEDVPEAYQAALGDAAGKLAAVYRPAPGIERWDAAYIAVIGTGRHPNGASAGVALHVNNGRIAAIEDDCGDVLRLFDKSRVGSWVVRPGATGPAATATPAG